MIRFFVILVACLGAFFGLAMLSAHLPQIGHTAFHVSTFAVTWVMLGVCAMGITTYKVTK